MVRYILMGYRNSFVVTGHCNRPEFWCFAPVGLITAFGIVYLLRDSITVQPEIVSALFVFSVCSLPVWTACVRRLRDAGKTASVVWLAYGLQFISVGYFGAMTLCGNEQHYIGTITCKIGDIFLFFGPAIVLFVFAPIMLLITSLLLAAFKGSEPGPNPQEVST